VVKSSVPQFAVLVHEERRYWGEKTFDLISGCLYVDDVTNTTLLFRSALRQASRNTPSLPLLACSTAGRTGTGGGSSGKVLVICRSEIEGSISCVDNGETGSRLRRLSLWLRLIGLTGCTGVVGSIGVESSSATVLGVEAGMRLIVPIGAADAVIDIFSLAIVSDAGRICAPQLTGFLLISEP